MYDDPFADPAPPQFTGDTLLERIARALEQAVDDFGDACDTEADAENAYRLLHAKTWAVAVEDGVAIAKRKRCAAKVEELQSRQTSCMSYQRFQREAT